MVEEHFSPGQFAYREDGNYTGPLLAIQHTIQKYLDSPECRAVRPYAMNSSKDFGSVKHYLSAAILKKLPKSLYYKSVCRLSTRQATDTDTKHFYGERSLRALVRLALVTLASLISF